MRIIHRTFWDPPPDSFRHSTPQLTQPSTFGFWFCLRAFRPLLPFYSDYIFCPPPVCPFSSCLCLFIYFPPSLHHISTRLSPSPHLSPIRGHPRSSYLVIARVLSCRQDHQPHSLLHTPHSRRLSQTTESPASVTPVIHHPLSGQRLDPLTPASLSCYLSSGFRSCNLPLFHLTLHPQLPPLHLIQPQAT